jgi:uncharacterized protein YndB with AHSA1/START domain
VKFIKPLLIGLAVLLALLVVVALLLPSSAHVERSLFIQAPPAVVFDLADDLRSFNRWSPWARLDPETRYTFHGPESGVGARMDWQSRHPAVGSGSQEVIALEPGRRLVVALEFGNEGMGTAYYVVQPEDEGTRTTWGSDTDFGNDLVGRYIGLFLGPAIGAEYEKGLANLKVLAEGT